MAFRFGFFNSDRWSGMLVRRWRSIGVLLCLVLPWQASADSFEPITGVLTIPLVVVGNTAYSNVQITVGTVLSLGAGPAAALFDSYDPVTNQLTIPSVTVGTLTYTNVVITVGRLLSVGAAAPVSASAPVLALVNPLGAATVGKAYSANVVAGIVPPSTYTYMMDTLANGALPSGMTLNINGVLSGTPFATGRTDVSGAQIAKTYSFGVCAVDTLSRVATNPCPQTSVTVNPAPVACSYSYSSWSSCQAGQQTRTVLSSSPSGCAGTPVLTQACTSASAACYYCQFDVACRAYGAGGCWRCSNSVVVGDSCQAPSTALVYYGGSCAADPSLYQICQ